MAAIACIDVMSTGRMLLATGIPVKEPARRADAGDQDHA